MGDTTKQDEDVITIKIHGTPANRQRIVNEFFSAAYNLVDRLYQDSVDVHQWGWTIESSREPETDFAPVND